MHILAESLHGSYAGLEAPLLDVDRVPVLAIGWETKVVELHLVEAQGDDLLGDAHVVVPDLYAEGVHPAELLQVAP